MIDDHSRVALFILLVSLGSTVWLAHRAGSRAHGPGAPALATDASSALLALLGLLLAFTVSLSVSRFESRRQLVIEEANAIGTAALRTQLLAEPFATKSARLLREYTANRVRWGEATREAAVEAEAEAVDASLQAQLWKLAIAAGEGRRDPQHALYIAALNAVVDIHGERVYARNLRVPETVFSLLAAVAMLALGVASYVGGRNGARRARDFHALAVAVWLVIGLVIDLDQPRRGWITISQAPLAALAESLQAN